MNECRSAREVLVWSRGLVDPALRAAVDTLPEPVRRVTAYHFGWVDERNNPAQGNGGKALRPALVLLAAEAVGGQPAAAVPAAAAVELVHNFSLLHDDVLDGDVTRRHRATAWTVFGRGAAILAGDALLALAYDVLAASGHRASGDAMRALGTAVQALVAGQTADLAFERRADVDLPECTAMAEDKTAALLGCSCALGAMFGGGTPEQAAYLHGFGVHLGLAFQHVDDLLGIWGDAELTGKPVYADLGRHKKSLPVVAALTSGTPAGHELAELYRRGEALSGVDLRRAAELVDIAGGRAWSQAQAETLLARALHDLRSAAPTPRGTAELSALAELATSRDR